jgi:large subunit ribosomal protein L31
MKTDIHPNYAECRVHCSCGNEFTTRSTVPSLRVELCSECHPFFTGKQKLVDTGGRVERFNRRLAKSAPAKPAKPAAKTGAKTAAKTTAKTTGTKAAKPAATKPAAEEPAEKAPAEG